MRYNKLVRDKIPEIVKRRGGNPITHIADENEFWGKLMEKLKEEVDEFIERRDTEEIVDILEVIDTICEFMKFNEQDIRFF